MKTPLALLCGALVAAFFASSAQAQYQSPRRYLRPISPPAQYPSPPPNRPQPLPPSPAVTQPPHSPTALSPAESAKASSEKDQAAKRLFEYQLKRAQEGSSTAQFDLATRYLKGDGTEKNPAEARRWLDAAAKQGHDGAKKKLKQLDENPPPAAAETRAEGGDKAEPAKPTGATDPKPAEPKPPTSPPSS